MHNRLDETTKICYNEGAETCGVRGRFVFLALLNKSPFIKRIHVLRCTFQQRQRILVEGDLS